MAKDFEILKTDRATSAGTLLQIEEKDGKFYANLIDITEGGERLPTRRSFLKHIGSGDNAFMVIDAPLRETNEAGEYLTRPRMKDGQYLDGKGKPVDNETLAAREWVYKTHRDDTSKLVYGQVATLNVKNEKKDGSPTESTMFNVKLFTDAEALKAAQVAFKLSKLEKGSSSYKEVSDEVNAIRKATGRYETFFITKGFDSLREMGYTIRERAKQDNSPSPA